MKKTRLILLFFSFEFLIFHFIFAQQGGKFVFTQLKYSGNWDTRHSAWDRISELLTASTSVKSVPERRTVQITDERLFWSPFLVISGDSEYLQLTADEIKILRKYIQCGGMVFIDDSSGRKASGFDKSVRDAVTRISPENALEKIPASDAIFKSFYLMQEMPGRIMTNRYLEGCRTGERYVIIYSQNDLLGAWEKDNLGNYIYPCDDKQRWEAKKMMINIILYSLTGTYKSDAVHSPFIKSKLK